MEQKSPPKKRSVTWSIDSFPTVENVEVNNKKPIVIPDKEEISYCCDCFWYTLTKSEPMKRAKRGSFGILPPTSEEDKTRIDEISVDPLLTRFSFDDIFCPEEENRYVVVYLLHFISLVNLSINSSSRTSSLSFFIFRYFICDVVDNSDEHDIFSSTTRSKNGILQDINSSAIESVDPSTKPNIDDSVPPSVNKISTKNVLRNFSVHNLAWFSCFKFSVYAFLSFLLLTSSSYYFYGDEYIQEALVFHLKRFY